TAARNGHQRTGRNQARSGSAAASDDDHFHPGFLEGIHQQLGWMIGCTETLIVLQTRNTFLLVVSSRHAVPVLACFLAKKLTDPNADAYDDDHGEDEQRWSREVMHHETESPVVEPDCRALPGRREGASPSSAVRLDRPRHRASRPPLVWQ